MATSLRCLQEIKMENIYGRKTNENTMGKRIGLIDVDGHHFPNLALMKLSAYHKSIGDTVEWHSADVDIYDTVYMSKVFSNTYSPDIPEPTNAKQVFKGGSGYAISLTGGARGL